MEKQLRNEYVAAVARGQILDRQVHRNNLKNKEIDNDRMVQGWNTVRRDSFFSICPLNAIKSIIVQESQRPRSNF